MCPLQDERLLLNYVVVFFSCELLQRYEKDVVSLDVISVKPYHLFPQCFRGFTLDDGSKTRNRRRKSLTCSCTRCHFGCGCEHIFFLFYVIVLKIYQYSNMSEVNLFS